jgi:hypothetical protein
MTDHLATLKAALGDAIQRYLAGDSRAWDEALVHQQRLESLRSTVDADVAVGPDRPLPTCRHPNCRTITLGALLCWKHRREAGA